MNAVPLEQENLFQKTKISHHQVQRQPLNSSVYKLVFPQLQESMKATG